MERLFEPKIRDQAIETTCQNLVMATALSPKEVADFMRELTGYTDVQLAIALCESRLSLDNWLEKCWNLN